MYDWKIRDVSLIKPYQTEHNENGSITLFVDCNESYDEMADKEEMEEINDFYDFSKEMI